MRRTPVNLRKGDLLTFLYSTRFPSLSARTRLTSWATPLQEPRSLIIHTSQPTGPSNSPTASLFLLVRAKVPFSKCLTSLYHTAPTPLHHNEPIVSFPTPSGYSFSSHILQGRSMSGYNTFPIHRKASEVIEVDRRIVHGASQATASTFPHLALF